ncbi:MAG: LamG-like jellyroll fold domain-containing protein, partial [Candidatus Dormibacteraceae bacterium]
MFSYGSGGYALAMFNNGQLFLTKVEASSTASTAQITDTAWHHVAVTKSGSTVEFYVDGTPHSGGSYNPGSGFGTPAAIGMRGDNSSAGFLGSLDEISIYNRGLTQGEIQAICNAGSAGKCPPALKILAQPEPAVVIPGNVMTFDVTVQGEHPLNYQWQLNRTNIPGGNSSELTIGNIQATNSGLYRVIVTSPGGVTNSEEAMLTVNLGPPACAEVVDGLVDWWPGNGNASDLQGGNDGQLAGNAGFGPGLVGQAFVLDGSGDGIQVGNPAGLQVQDFTIEAWVKRASTNLATLSQSGTGTILGYGQSGYLFGLFNDGHLFLSAVGASAVN